MLQWPARLSAYSLLCVLDHGIWILIQLLPGPIVMDLARTRPWQRYALRIRGADQQRWRGRIAWLLRIRCQRAGWWSTCLSRSLTGRLLLDGIGVANDLHLGMSQFRDGRKVPHAWLVDPCSGRLYTPGLSHGAGVALTQF